MKKAMTVITTAITVDLMACTAWVAAPDISANGKLFIHKTRDWGEGKEIPVTLKHATARGGKYRALAFSPYMLFNEKGLGMADTSLPKTADYPEDEETVLNVGGTMTKVAFHCATVQEALEKLTEMTQDGSNPKSETYLLCDPKEAAIVEISPKHIAYRIIAAGIAVHTNHFIFPEMAYLSRGTTDGAVKSATRLQVTMGQFIEKMKEHDKISLADSVDVARFHDEKYPDMCPFRNATVCASDYFPDAEYPDVLGTLNIIPGPTCYAVSIPIPTGIKKIPAVLKNEDFGKLAYKLKRKDVDKMMLRDKYLPLEEKFREEYKATLDAARELLASNKREEALEMLQSLTDRQVDEAYRLMQEILEQAGD
ncbi:MAG: carcinine hydrolase/isopenicillin-N N-acyltransferase family protein [Lentisphaeria bacterium]|jgi:hypothetical protein